MMGPEEQRNSVRAVVRLDLPLFAVKESRLNYPFFAYSAAVAIYIPRLAGAPEGKRFTVLRVRSERGQLASLSVVTYSTRMTLALAEKVAGCGHCETLYIVPHLCTLASGTDFRCSALRQGPLFRELFLCSGMVRTFLWAEVFVNFNP